jgi:predicted GNAT family N-acyltransferase
MGIEIRLLTDQQQELEALYRFRYAIYRNKVGARVPEADQKLDQLMDAYDTVAYQYACFRNGDIIGSLRVFDCKDLEDSSPLATKYILGSALQEVGKNAIAFAGRLAVEQNARKGMLMVRLMQLAMREARQRGIRIGVLDCSAYLLPIYEGLGFKRYEEPFNDPVYGLKIPLLFLLGDYKGLSKIDSPLAEVAKEFGDDEEARDWYEQEYGTKQTAATNRSMDSITARFNELRSGGGNTLSLFSDFSEEEIAAVLRKSALIHANKGDLIICAGLNESFLFIILSGQVHVMNADDCQNHIATMGRGEFLGEIAFLTGSGRTKDVMAAEACDLLLINGEILHGILKRNNEIARKFHHNLSVALAMRMARR